MKWCKKILKAGGVAIVATLFTQCTNQQLFESVRANKRASCYQLPPAEQEQCLRESAQTYDEYEQVRSEGLD